MRIISLYIDKYRIIEDFNINFDFEHCTTVIIGKNGTGKTTLIECFTKIFSNLLKAENLSQLKETLFPFKFDIKYLLKTEKSIETKFLGEVFTNYIVIEISNLEDKVNIILHEGDKSYENTDNIIKYLRTIGEDISYLLPDKIVTYYSGISEIISNNFKDFQKQKILGSLDGETKMEQPYFHFLPENFPIILIGLLSYQFGDVPTLLSKKFFISGFDNISINLKKPKWARAKSRDFWGARGDLKIFLERLKEACQKVYFEDNKITFVIKNINQLQNIWEFYGSEKGLFEYLVSLQANDLIEIISISLEKNGITIPHQRLSEGEMQLLTIIGVKELLAADNSLFLLDEPDTYLHPEWKVIFFDDLFLSGIENITIDSEYPEINAHFIVTTHSPMLISNLRSGDVINFDSGKPRRYTGRTFGKDTNTILVETMKSVERTPLFDILVRELENLIKENKIIEAREKLNFLKKYLRENEPILIRLESIIKRKEIINK